MSKILYLCELTLVAVKENGALKTHSCHCFCWWMPKSFFVDFFPNKLLFLRAKKMLISKIFKRGWKYRFADWVRENYFITDPRKYIFLKGAITLG